MNHGLKIATLWLLLSAFGLTGCASSTWKRMANTDGLLYFVFGSSTENATPIERVSRGGGQVTTAHITTFREKVYVSGLVGRQSPGSPPPWAHVDVIVLDSQQRVIESAIATYLPREIPHGQRSGSTHSRYTARLKALPTAGSSVKVVFHSAHSSDCEFNNES